ncbi:MAG: hypothetical protein IKF19_02965 [Bacilli bacterium]|nr:hypothetical protein [Bacilli bacterium]
MIKKIKNRINNKYLYLLFFMGVFILHLFFKFSRDDIDYFNSILDKMSIINFINMRYNTWTSRIIIESVLVIVSRYIYLWRLINSFIITLLVYSINILCFKKPNTKNISITMISVLIYPLIDMTGAGFASCTTNYLWPLAFMLFSFIPYRKYYLKEQIDNKLWPLYIGAILYASNQEQCVIIIFTVSLIMSIISIKQKKNYKYPLISLAISIISIIFILTCPGNMLRNTSEISRWYPDYVNANIMDKIYLAVLSSVSILLNNGIVLWLFCLILFITIIKTKTKIFNKILSLILLIITSLLSAYRFITIITSKDNLIFNYQTKIGHVFKCNLNNFIIAFACIIPFIIIFYLLYIILNKKSIVPIFILILGLGTRLMMGFSPTIFASGRRTEIYLYFSLILVMIYLIKFISSKLKLIEKNIIIVIMILCLIVNIGFLFIKM